MDRFDAMQAFVAVADRQSFASAARKLKLSPSAITRLVAALEERLGARLLQRTTRKVALTDAGTRYLERARRILADVEEAEHAAESERTRPSGRLVVSAPVGFGRLHVSPVMSAYLKARGEPKTPAAIATHDTIQFGGSVGLADWRFVDAGRDIRIGATPRFVTNSADAAIQYAVDGGGLTRVLAYQAAAALKAGKVRIVLEKFEQAPQPIHIVYPTSRLLSAKVRAFIDLVSETTDWRFG